MTSKFTSTICRVAKKGAIKLKKYAPEILVALGVTGTAVSTVMACKATLKARPVLDKAKEDLDSIHTADNDPRVSYEEYSKEQVKKDITKVCYETGKNLAKIYGPSIILEVGSLACLVGSHVMVKRRLNYALAAYTALSNSFREYRRRLEDNLGEDVAKITDYKEDADGHVIPLEDKPIYTLIFDRSNPNWKDCPEFNLTFLKGVQRYLDYELQRWGILSANDAMKDLGYEPTENGQLDVWTYDFDSTEDDKNYVSFGLYNKDGSKTEQLIRYENGEVDYLVLKLNVNKCLG